MNKKLKCIIACIFILIGCFSCKDNNKYKVSSYFSELSFKSGISTSDNFEERINALINYGIINNEHLNILNDDLTYIVLANTICNLLEENNIDYLKDKNWVNKKIKDNDLIYEKQAIKIIDNAVQIINNPKIKNEYYFEQKEGIISLNEYNLHNNELETTDKLSVGDILYLEDECVYKKIVSLKDNLYILEDATLNETLNKLYICGNDYIDFNEANIITYDDNNKVDDSIKINYQNNNFELLSSNRKKFTSHGFDISYSISSSGIDARISKKIKDGPNIFYDINLSNIKPKYKWKYENGVFEESFFKIDYKCSTEFGLSTAKYDNYYLDLKNKDSSSFLNFVKKSIHKKDDEIEASFPICTIQTPIPNIPFVTLNIEILVNIYVSGKIEVLAINKGCVGFEIRNNNLRVIHDIDRDFDFKIGGSIRNVVGLNFNLTAVNYRLMDIELDAGIRAAISTIVHLYDKEGNKNEEEIDIDYSIIQDLSKENNDVKVCGDLSLNWVCDLKLNTSKTLLNKIGLSHTFSILDEKNQILGNKTHIENWQFMEKCTRKERYKISKSDIEKTDSNKIILGKYSVVLNKGEKYEIPILSLPSGYDKNDLKYNSQNSDIVKCSDGFITASEIGSTSIVIKTNDDKYKAAINVLVSTG